MTDDVAIVACEALRATVASIAPDVDVAYVAHELHESPLDPGDDTAVAAAVQTAVDDLSTPTRPYVALAYARSSAGLAAVTAGAAPLVVWRATDCADALCGHPGPDGGEAKAPGTYYLTPGAIDAGLDPYKLHLAYTGRTHRLVRHLADAGRTPRWHERQRLAALRARDVEPDPDLLRGQFARQFCHYDRVVLLETPAVAPVHRGYARCLAAYLEELCDAPVTVTERSADLDALEALVGGAAATDARFDVAAPGQPLGDGTTLRSQRAHP